MGERNRPYSLVYSVSMRSIFTVANAIIFSQFLFSQNAAEASGIINAPDLESFRSAEWKGSENSVHHQYPSKFKPTLERLDSTIVGDGVWVEEPKTASPILVTYTFTELVNNLKFCDVTEAKLSVKYFTHHAAAQVSPCKNVNGGRYCNLPPSEQSVIEWKTEMVDILQFDEIKIEIMAMPGGYFMFDNVVIEHNGREAVDGSCEPTTTTEPTDSTEFSTTEVIITSTDFTTETADTEGTGPTFYPIPSTLPTTSTTTTEPTTTTLPTTTTRDPTASTEEPEMPETDFPSSESTFSTESSSESSTAESTTELTTTSEDSSSSSTLESSAEPSTTTEMPGESTTSSDSSSTDPPTSTASSLEPSTKETTKPTSSSSSTTEIVEPSTTESDGIPPITGTAKTTTVSSIPTIYTSIRPTSSPSPGDDKNGLSTEEIILFIVLPAVVGTGMLAFLGTVFYFGIRKYGGKLPFRNNYSRFSGNKTEGVENGNATQEQASPASMPPQARTMPATVQPTSGNPIMPHVSFMPESYPGQMRYPNTNQGYLQNPSAIGNDRYPIYHRPDTRMIQGGSGNGRPTYSGEYTSQSVDRPLQLPRMRRK